VVIHAGEDRFLTRTTLKHLCSVLPPREFIRIDRSLLVNLRRVDYVERLENGRFSFSMRQGKHQVMSSRERSPAILRLLRSGLL
jgi:DNA-binding LytR/AlgR family response regulator